MKLQDVARWREARAPGLQTVESARLRPLVAVCYEFVLLGEDAHLGALQKREMPLILWKSQVPTLGRFVS